MKALELLDISPEHSHFVVFVLLEVEPELPAESELQEVVVKAFLADADFTRCFFEGDFDGLPLGGGHAVVKFSPFADLFYYKADFPFFRPS